MLLLRRGPVAFVLSLALLPAALFGAAAKPAQVQASLVAADAAVQPGRPVTVALRLAHNPHWHT